MALARVQATGRVSAPSSTTVSLTFPTPPTVGNGLVILVICYQSTFPTTGCADNRGHTYQQAITQGGASGAAAIYYLPKVVTSAAPFTVTVTAAGSTYLEAAAIEVSGVGTGLAVDQTAAQAGNSSTPSSGTSPAVTATEVFVAAVHANGSNQASITVEVLSPPWVQEFENLNYSATIAGEGDTRVRTSAAGTTQIANWTTPSVSFWSAVLAAFSTTSSTAVNLSQLPVEVLRGSQPLPALRLSQLPVEILRGSLPAPALRLSQLPIEVLRGPSPTTAGRLSQLVVETLYRVIPDPRLTQVVVETITATPVPRVPLRATQLLTETLSVLPPAPVAVTQVAVEYVNATLIHEAHVTQILCELLIIARVNQGCPPVTDFPIDPATGSACATSTFPVD